jgi:hypothetical protein
MADEGGGEGANLTDDLKTVISDAEADMLIAEADRQREEQIPARPMLRQLRLVGGCGVGGLLLLGVGFRGYGFAVIAYVAGALVLAVTGLLLLRALEHSPVTQWGEPAAASCPVCGERNLREGRVAVSEASGIVVQCTPECGYADVRPEHDERHADER